jgi:hypothetical protein
MDQTLRTGLRTGRGFFSGGIRVDRRPAAPVMDFGKTWSG